MAENESLEMRFTAQFAVFGGDCKDEAGLVPHAEGSHKAERSLVGDLGWVRIKSHWTLAILLSHEKRVQCSYTQASIVRCPCGTLRYSVK